METKSELAKLKEEINQKNKTSLYAEKITNLKDKIKNKNDEFKIFEQEIKEKETIKETIEIIEKNQELTSKEQGLNYLSENNNHRLLIFDRTLEKRHFNLLINCFKQKKILNSPEFFVEELHKK
jgi:hypothetical protein